MGNEHIRQKALEFHEALRNFTTAEVNSEWAYFSKYARRFESNSPEEKYGILIMHQSQSSSNMIYAADPLELRIKHLQALVRLGISNDPGERQRHFLDWLERMEGKQ